ncbi:MAG: hypothetical protein ACRBC3_23060 [Burkholderiaceae bacterium]
MAYFDAHHGEFGAEPISKALRLPRQTIGAKQPSVKPSVGARNDCCDNALAETSNGL